MWQGSYGKEPFDLRLTMLRFMRCLNRILLLTLAGTVLFGGGYYVKNVLMHPEKEYSATSTFKVEYEVPPTQSGDYYINSMTWNTLVQSQEFLVGVQAHLAEMYGILPEEITAEELKGMLSATLPSDWNVPTVTVVADSPDMTIQIAAAAEAAMENEFVENMQEIKSVRVIDSVSVAEEVKPDVRPVRAVVLSAVLSLFFAVVIFLLKEIGDDGIWLPSTLRQRYGLAVLGTVNSPELKENINYLFREKTKIAVCPLDDRIDVAEVINELAEKGVIEKCSEGADSADNADGAAAKEIRGGSAQHNWIGVPAPVSHPESCRDIRESDGMLLVVPAGSHSGKPLEYVMEFLAQQDCEITAVILWNADEKLLKAYYCLGSSER